eukprot:TRINITY_DN6412_c0_g1_i1.p1 TRINITY_DN6412_c0_g1~~TRINITY_DN6412_c0_g1_i1.p1  ORF type:complete len:186 (-),score=24.42 TRINITY_DN6412_c0_g1_i1:170-727(-)
MVHSPADPILFPSFRNHYIVRRSDGYSIDGKYFGLSKYLFNSSSSKLNTTPNLCVDTSWISALNHQHSRSFLDSFLNRNSETRQQISENLVYVPTRSPLNFGQMINHYNFKNNTQNVTYFEYVLPSNFPCHLRSFIPNMYYPNGIYEELSFDEQELRMVVLIATRDINDQELFSDNHWIARSIKN